MKLSSLLALLFPSVAAFELSPLHSRRTALWSSAADTGTVPIGLTGQNIELTPALVDHVKKRIGGTLNKLSSGGGVKDCDVTLAVSKNPKVKNGHRVEVVTKLKGTTIISQNESPDMYESIDQASHALNRKLRKYKERRTAGWHGGANMEEDLRIALEALEEINLPPSHEDSDYMGFEDPEKPVVTKVNSFDLKKQISVDEAVFALDYVDHDFYVFRNEETSKISVVYKRHGGGVGLIEP